MPLVLWSNEHLGWSEDGFFYLCMAVVRFMTERPIDYTTIQFLFS